MNWSEVKWRENKWKWRSPGHGQSLTSIMRCTKQWWLSMMAPGKWISASRIRLLVGYFDCFFWECLWYILFGLFCIVRLGTEDPTKWEVLLSGENWVQALQWCNVEVGTIQNWMGWLVPWLQLLVSCLKGFYVNVSFHVSCLCNWGDCLMKWAICCIAGWGPSPVSFGALPDGRRCPTMKILKWRCKLQAAECSGKVKNC